VRLSWLLFSSGGKCLEMPGQETAAGFDIHSYPVVERHECIWVWTGDPTRADHTLVPESRLTENGLAFRTGVLEFSSDYQLINDNLCDFSHVAYVHEKTLGQGQTEWAQQLPALSSLDNGIRVTRWIEGAMMPPTPGIEPGLRIDQYTAYDYVVPGVITMQVEAHPLGTAKRLAFQPPPASMEGAIYVMRTLQMATPISEGRARYLYGVSHPVDPARGMLLRAIAVINAPYPVHK
jgi:phenylpropionate dioxygenase-like ring-hydroxylating dioxygenase large terminal subunit